MTSNPNSLDFTSERATRTNAQIDILGVNIILSQVSNRNPSIKLIADGETLGKQSIAGGIKLKWSLNKPYTLRSGQTLTIQLREKRLWPITRNKPISSWGLSFADAVKATSLSAGQKTEHKLDYRSSIILILNSPSPKFVPHPMPPHQDIQSHSVDLTDEIEALSKHKNVLDYLGKTRTFLETLLRFGTALSEIHPVAKAVLASINEVHKILKEQEIFNAQILDLVKEMALTIGYVEDMDQFARLPQLVKAMKEVDMLVEETRDFVKNHCSNGDRNALLPTVSSSSNNKLKNLLDCFTQFKRQFDRGIAVQATINTEKMSSSLQKLLEAVQDDKILEILKQPEIRRIPLPQACMENTRQDIIAEVEKWSVDFDAPNILWIKGYPGVGKTAIASKLVERFGELKRLGSSFFFDRANSALLNPRKLWLATAYDLAQIYPTIRRHLLTKIEGDLNIAATPNVNTLFREIIHQGLEENKDIPVGRLPIVILDALDECGGLEGRHSEDRSILMRTLKLWSKLPRQYKLVVTSRGERDLENSLKDISQVIDIKVGSDVTHQSLEDIQEFLTSHLIEVTDEYPTLVDWPGKQAIQDLTIKSGGLFIWARVVVEYIKRGDPEERLGQIRCGAIATNKMSALYSTILENAFRGSDPEDFRACHNLLGVVITVRAPLSQTTIEDLLGIKATRIQRICNELKSVLASDTVVRITHQSFTDFLINRDACSSPFFIEVQEEERRLALASL